MMEEIKIILKNIYKKLCSIDEKLQNINTDVSDSLMILSLMQKDISSIQYDFSEIVERNQ